MSTSGSFWSQIRWRLGGSDSMLAQISDLVQKQIDANAEAQEVTEEDLLNPIIVSPSKLVIRDNLYRAIKRSVSQGIINFIPVDPDLTDMRLWIRNDHGGRYINDHSFMGNKIQLNGSDQSKLMFSTDDDQIEGSSVVNQLINDQYLRVEDKDKSPNPNVRIKEIAATAEGITVLLRIYVQLNDNEALYGKPGVLFSKIDTEQADFAYGAYMKTDGSLFWFVRDTGKEYTLTAPPASLDISGLNLADFSELNFSPQDFNTVNSLSAIPDPIPFTDIAFTYKFSDKRMQIIKSDVATAPAVIADSTTRPEGTGLVGWWRLNEGGDIGNTPDSPSVFTRFAYNSVATGNNGTIANATWDTTTVPGAPYLRFDGNGDTVDISNYTAINNLSSGTVSLWYNHDGNVSTTRRLIYKNTVAAANSWIIEIGTNGRVTFTARNSSNTAFSTSPTTVLSANTWYHIVARWTLGTSGKVSINGAHTTGTTPTGTMDTGATTLRFGDTGTNCAAGIIHDVKIWNRNLSDAEVTTVNGVGRSPTYLPKWQANPPSVPPPPSPITNPFIQVYNAPVPASAEQDLVRLHAITAASLTERYNVGQGAQQTPGAVSEDGQYYSNDPTYDPGTGGEQEVLSDYSTMTTTAGQYMLLDQANFGGERVLTGINIIGKPITKVVAKMADVNPTDGPATGTIVCKIKKDSDNTNQATSSTVDATTLANNLDGTSTSAWTDVTFTFTGNTYNMVNNDRIQFEYQFDSGAGGGGGGGSPPSGTILAGYNFLNATIGAVQEAYTTYRVTENYTGLHDIIGEDVTGIVVKLCDAVPSTPATGNITAAISNSSGTVLQTSTNSFSAASLADNSGGTPGGSWTNVPFYFTSNTFASGNNIEIRWNYNGTTSAARVGVACTSSSVSSSCNVINRSDAGTQTFATNDIVMDVYTTDG